MVDSSLSKLLNSKKSKKKQGKKSLNSKKYKEVRGNFANADRNHSPCNRCDANGMMMGEEFVGKWEKYYEGEKTIKK